MVIFKTDEEVELLRQSNLLVSATHAAIVSHACVVTVAYPVLTITTQVVATTFTVGDSATLTVGVSGGDGTYTYVWKAAGVVMSGQTGATLTIPNVQTSHAKHYQAEVTSNKVTVKSANVVLTVNNAPITISDTQAGLTIVGTVNGKATATAKDVAHTTKTVSKSASISNGDVITVTYVAAAHYAITGKKVFTKTVSGLVNPIIDETVAIGDVTLVIT